MADLAEQRRHEKQSNDAERGVDRHAATGVGGSSNNILANEVDSEGYAMYDSRVFGMAGGLVGRITSQNLQVRSQNGQQ